MRTAFLFVATVHGKSGIVNSVKGP